MTLFWHTVSAVTLLFWLYLLADAIKGFRTIARLPRPGEEEPANPPLVSIIVAAKEEESTVAETVKHLLNETYPRLEIIAVNDRSTDATGVRLDELKKWSERKGEISVPLRIIHITHLPQGWLGKNHALYQGYLQARGQYLLFTDADVRFHPDTVRAAMAFLREQRADHLTLAPAMISRSFWLKAFVHYFLFCLSIAIRPWRANLDDQTTSGMGIGAFNLISRKAYEAIGTHKAIAMRPDDDLQLGALVKKLGFRQRLALGSDFVQVEWYSSLGQAVRGLEKNVFSGFRYRVSWVALALLAQAVFFLLPFAAVWFVSGWSLVWYILSIAIMLGLYIVHTRKFAADSWADVVALPCSVLLLGFVVIRSVALTFKRNGVYWRGTFYPFDELRKTRR